LTFSPGFIKNEIKNTYNAVGHEINMIDEEAEIMNQETVSMSTNKYKTAGFSEPSLNGDRDNSGERQSFGIKDNAASEY
jgi:hypothetical protein